MLTLKSLNSYNSTEFLLDLAEFKTGAAMFNALAENNTSELGSRMQSLEFPRRTRQIF